MKKKLPPFIAGMLTMALIGSLGIGALAAANQLTITVDPVNIQVNGATFVPKDAKGNSVPVFALNGTTYAPLRALAEAYGLDVWYDPESTMAAVGAKGSAPAETPPLVPSDPNRVPDITVDELKAMFKFDQTYELNGIDIYNFMYCGNKPISEFWAWCAGLNQKDVEDALAIWVKDFYTNEYKGNKEVGLALKVTSDMGTVLDVTGIGYSPNNGANDFYFKW